jgi:hypothetical protein
VIPLDRDIAELLISLEDLSKAKERIRSAEKRILQMSRDRLPDEGDGDMSVLKMLDDLLLLIDNIEVKANQLDVQLSAIERLTEHHE